MEGIVPFLKPPGMSSSDAVFDIRKLYHEKRAGHLGTLDPGAAGVLPVCLGRTARLFDFLVDKEKTYRFECVFGKATDTQDSLGKVTDSVCMNVSANMLENVLPSFRGRILQKAPAYSALKYNGKKLYDLALAGLETPDKIRPITISSLLLLRQTGENRFLLEVTCSRGTYVRTLCHDLGLALGGFAHMGLLIRTAAGPFKIEHCYTSAELSEYAQKDELQYTLVSAEDALSVLPEVRLGSDRLFPVRNGLTSSIHSSVSGPCRVYCGDAFMGAGIALNGEVKLKVHLY